LSVVLIIVVQPYKKASHNTIDCLLMLTLAVHTVTLMSISLSVECQHTQRHTALVLATLSTILPLLYLTVILLNWVYHCRVFASLCKMCKRFRQVHIYHTSERQRRHARKTWTKCRSDGLPWWIHPAGMITWSIGIMRMQQMQRIWTVSQWHHLVIRWV